MNRRTLLWLGVWAILLASASLADQPVAHWAYSHGFHDSRARIFNDALWANAVKWLGTYYCVLVLAAILLLTGILTWRKVAVLLMCAATAVVADPMKWIVGRSRPVNRAGLLSSAMDFVPFSHRAPGNSFPSGHTLLAFATATCLARYYPRWSPLFFILAALVAVERVLEVAHYASDVAAAAGIGIIFSRACMWASRRWLPEPAPVVLETARDPKP